MSSDHVFGAPVTARPQRGERMSNDWLHTHATAGAVIFNREPATTIDGTTRKGVGEYAHMLQPAGRVVNASVEPSPHRVLHMAVPPKPPAGMGTVRTPSQPSTNAPPPRAPVATAGGSVATPRAHHGSFLDDLLPRRGQTCRTAPSGSERVETTRRKPYAVRDLQEAAHLSDGVPAHVFNAGPTASRPSTALRSHPSFHGAAGVPSDSSIAQAHPDLPGDSGTPRAMPGHTAALEVGRAAEELTARREALLTPGGPPNLVPNTVLPTSRFPWEPEANVPASRPAPPKEYASSNAAPAERARFRGVRKVDTPLARESFPEPGGILNQGRFADAAPRRWDDAAFENRLKHAIGQGAYTPARTSASRRPASATTRPRRHTSPG